MTEYGLCLPGRTGRENGRPLPGSNPSRVLEEKEKKSVSTPSSAVSRSARPRGFDGGGAGGGNGSAGRGGCLHPGQPGFGPTGPGRSDGREPGQSVGDRGRTEHSVLDCE